jgi:uncharacterized MAPEG superfamily protein
MTLAEWMIFLAVILYLMTIAPVKAVGYRFFDNSNPRDPTFYGPGIASRTLGAHINGIETFPFFAAAVLLAEFRKAPQHWIDALSVAFLCIRVIFVIAYLGNWPTTRTVLWNLGFALNAATRCSPLNRTALAYFHYSIPGHGHLRFAWSQPQWKGPRNARGDVGFMRIS